MKVTQKKTERSSDFERLGTLLSTSIFLGLPNCVETGNSEDPNCSSTNNPGDVFAGDAISRRLTTVWPEVVGEEISAHTKPLQLKQGRLTVSTSSSAWAHTLQFMAEDIGKSLNTCLGVEGLVKEIRFWSAGWE